MTLESCRPGSGQLRVRMSCGQSTATSVQAASPLKLLVPRARGPSVWACVTSLGGGLVAGDELCLNVGVGQGARCFLGTQASTKVYRNPAAGPCSQTLQAELGHGALLAVVPDPVQSFRGSRYRQHQQLRLEEDSGLVLVDWLCSGRVARGERWAFSRFQSRNEITLGGVAVLVDSLLLDPSDGPLAEPYRLGRFNCLALVAVVGGLLERASAGLLEQAANTPLSRRPGLVYSASPIRHGALLRIAGESVEAVAVQIHHQLAFLAEWLGETPWSRKY